MNDSMRPLADVLVVGGSLAGLIAAIALIRRPSLVNKVSRLESSKSPNSRALKGA